MSVQPTADDVRSAVKAVKQAHPELGVKKVVAEVKLAFPAWEIGAKEVRQALADLKAEAEAEAAALKKAAAEEAEAKVEAAARVAANLAAKRWADYRPADDPSGTSPDLPVDWVGIPGLLQAPPGFAFRLKYGFPEPDGMGDYCEGVRQMCSEGGDQCAEEDSDCDEVLKSSGVDPDFWENSKNLPWEGPNGLEAQLKTQFPDEWCHSRTPSDIFRMYVKLYDCSAEDAGMAMGIVPLESMHKADAIVHSVCAKQRCLDMHDPRRLEPLFSQTQRIAAHVMEDSVRNMGKLSAGPQAFVEACALLCALDESRGDSGWTYVMSRTGDILGDLSRLMGLTVAFVLLGMRNANILETMPEWKRAVRTALDMRGNLSSGGDSIDMLEPRLELYCNLLDPDEPCTQSDEVRKKLECDPQELVDTMDRFIAMHSRVVK